MTSSPKLLRRKNHIFSYSLRHPERKMLSASRMRVLIADDSEVIVQRLMALLAHVKGVEIVDQVGTVEETGEAVRRLRPDVVILDMQMPGGSGIDVLESMKKDRLISTVIVLTNHPYAPYRKKCLQVGAKFFLDKSSEFEKVSEVLQGLIRDADREAEPDCRDPEDV
jgi:DNA-binding NarL/FixJ family response regulator